MDSGRGPKGTTPDLGTLHLQYWIHSAGRPMVRPRLSLAVCRNVFRGGWRAYAEVDWLFRCHSATRLRSNQELVFGFQRPSRLRGLAAVGRETARSPKAVSY